MTFSSGIRRKISLSDNHLCLGIDPHPASFSASLQKLVMTHGPECILTDICYHAIDAAHASVGSIKFQMSFFEYYGAAGYAALKSSLAYAKSKGMFTILDAKRGDIATTMQAYGHMSYEELGADALTVLPYMGLAVVDPLIPWLRKGKGVYVVWVSSNPEGWAVQQQVYRSLLLELTSWSKKNALQEALGLVLGATKVDDIAIDALNDAMSFPLLLPGFGAQGAVVGATVKRIMAESSAPLFPVSRGLLDTSSLHSDARSDLGQAVSSVVDQNIQAFKRDFAVKP